MTLTSSSSLKILGSRCASGVSTPSTPGIAQKGVQLAPALEDRGAQPVDGGEILADSAAPAWRVPPAFAMASSVSSSPPTVRATQITCAPASPSAMAAARPMPREAPVTSAMRPSRRLCIRRASEALGDVRQQRKLAVARAAGNIGELDGIFARETGIAELRRAARRAPALPMAR